MRRIALIAWMACLLLCTACADKNVSLSGAAETTLGVNADGTVEEVTVEPFEADYYSKTELMAYIQAVVDAFNETHPQPVPETSAKGGGEAEAPDAITVVEVSTSGKTASMILRYQSVDLYNEFNQCDLKAMPIEDAVSSGIFTKTDSLMSASGKGPAAVDDLLSKTGFYVIVTQESHRVVTSGKLAYYTENVTGIDDHTAETAADGTSVILFKYNHK